MVFHSLACLSLVLGTLCSSVAALQISGSLLRQQVLNLDHEVSSRSARESAAHQLAPATKTTTRVLADSVHLCVQAAYNTTAAVQCPAGMMIESFQFASFGDPEASTSVACGHYRLGACHAVQTRAILQNFCTGQRICRVPVTNEFFGVPSHPGDGLDAHPVALRNGRDACRKAAESLAVEYRCVAAIGGSVEDRRYFDSLHEFYLGDDDEAGEQNMAGVSGTGSNALNGMSANAAGAGSAAAAAAAAAAADAAAAARLAAENELGAWKNEGWGTVHRCSWSGTPQPAQTWLTAGQMSDPAQPLFGRFRGRFMEDAGHLAAAGVLQALDVRDHSSHASQRPFNGTGEEERHLEHFHAQFFAHSFEDAECLNGLPSSSAGPCLAVSRELYHCGHPSPFWGILTPSDPHGPGVLWGNFDSCVPNEGRDPEAAVVVDYLCPTPLEAVHLYQCTFEGTLGVNDGDAVAVATAASLARAAMGPGDDGPVPQARDALARIVNTTRAAALTTTEGMPLRVHTHFFEPGECQNGLPPGANEVSTGCFTAIRWAEHCGNEFSWEAIIPSGQPSNGEGAGKAGIRWTSAENCSSVRAAVDFFCPMLHAEPIKGVKKALHYSLPDETLLRDPTSVASAPERVNPGTVAEASPPVIVLQPREQAVEAPVTVPSLHRCTFNGSFADVGKLSGGVCGRLYHGLVQGKTRVSGMSVRSEFTPSLYADMIGADEADCLFLPFGGKQGLEAWTCTNEASASGRAWRKTVDDDCLVSVNMYETRCFNDLLDHTGDDEAVGLVTGDALFKDWSVVSVSRHQVQYDGEAESNTTPSGLHANSEANTDETITGVRWAYSHSNGHNFRACKSNRIELRIDVLCPPDRD